MKKDAKKIYTAVSLPPSHEIDFISAPDVCAAHAKFVHTYVASIAATYSIRYSPSANIATNCFFHADTLSP